MSNWITSRSIGALTTFVTAALLTSYSFAHHANAPHYDNTKPISIEGVITDYQFVNPHSFLYLDVVGANGEVENWSCEKHGASAYQRWGWTEDVFPIGATVKVEGIAARRDPTGCSLNLATLADGTSYARNGAITEPEGNLWDFQAPALDEVDLNSMAGTWTNSPRAPGAQGGPRSGTSEGLYGHMLTEAGLAAANGYDQTFDDPALECRAASILRAFGSPFLASDISITDDEMVIRHEFMDTVRTIDLTTREHPENIEASLTGHSVGWYEGDTLVIETIGFKAGVLTPHPGLLHSSDMKAMERLRLSEDGMNLFNDYEITDAQYFTAPYTGSYSWSRTEIPVGEYDCTELSGANNVRTTNE